jgi:hypothetical protein
MPSCVQLTTQTPGGAADQHQVSSGAQLERGASIVVHVLKRWRVQIPRWQILSFIASVLRRRGGMAIQLRVGPHAIEDLVEIRAADIAVEVEL